MAETHHGNITTNVKVIIKNKSRITGVFMFVLYHMNFRQKIRRPKGRLLRIKYNAVTVKISPLEFELIKEKLKIEHQKLNLKILRNKLVKMKCDILKANRLQTGEILFH